MVVGTEARRWDQWIARFNSIRREDGLATASYRVLRFCCATLAIRAGRLRPREITIDHPRATFRMLGHWTWMAGVGKDYPRTGCHEFPVTSVIADILDDMDEPVFFDVGAATGYFALLAAQYTDPSNVHAFEGDDVSLSYLRQNNRRYADGRVAVVGEYVDPNRLRLDDYADRRARPDLVKIDVDGHETGVLGSMDGLLNSASRPVVVLEVHCWGDYRARVEAIRDYFDDGEYAAYQCIDHRNEHSGFTPVELGDLPATPPERADDYVVILCPTSRDLGCDEKIVASGETAVAADRRG